LRPVGGGNDPVVFGLRRNVELVASDLKQYQRKVEAKARRRFAARSK